MKSHIFLLAMTCVSGLLASQANAAYDLQLGSYNATHGSISISSRSETTEIQNNWVAKPDAHASKPILLAQASSSITNSSNNSQQSVKEITLFKAEGDLNQDGKPDSVRLIAKNNESLDLSISLSGNPQRTIHSKFPGFGDKTNLPNISITPQGELKLQSSERSGKYQAIQKVTIKMIQGELYIIEFFHEYWEGPEKNLKKGDKFSCILDLVKGTGTWNDKEVKFKSGGVKLATYEGDHQIINKGCND
jgi:hypothetical protein